MVGNGPYRKARGARRCPRLVLLLVSSRSEGIPPTTHDGLNGRLTVVAAWTADRFGRTVAQTRWRGARRSVSERWGENNTKCYQDFSFHIMRTTPFIS